MNFDRDSMVGLVHKFRESLGFEPADTESTFDPWDLVSLPPTGLNQMENGINMAYIDLVNHWLSQPAAVLEPLMEKHIKGNKRYTPQVYRAQFRANYSALYFYSLFQHLFEEEWINAPKYALHPITTGNIARAQSIRGEELYTYGHSVHTITDKRLFFDKVEREIFPNGLTFATLKSLTETDGDYGLGTYRLLHNSHSWFPSQETLFRRGNFDGAWDFIHHLPSHIQRDDRGRFTSKPFKKLDFLVYASEKGGGLNIRSWWTKHYVREWLFEYVFPHFDITLSREDFPHNCSEQELQMVINLIAEEMRELPGGLRVYSHLTNNMENGGTAIKKVVKYCWPNYRMVESAWSRATAGEKRANVMLEKVFAHAGEHFTHCTTTPLIDPESGEKRTYDITGHNVKVDGRSDSLRFALESQGDHHYVLYKNPDTRYDDSMYWKKEIPQAYLDHCAENDIAPPEDMLEYRQRVVDPECRTHIRAIGYTPIYLILSRHAYPVQGVHGDIPRWCGAYVTPDPSRVKSSQTDRIGLAETFDLQGRTDIGDMIRQYYEEVVCA